MENKNRLDVWKGYASNSEMLTFDLTKKDAVYIIDKKRLSEHAIANMIDLDVSFKNGYCYVSKKAHGFNRGMNC